MKKDPSGPSDLRTPRTLTTLLALATIFVAVLVVYARSLSSFFFEDDFQLLVRAWDFPVAELFHPRARFKPVFETYFLIGSSVFGRSTVAFHAASIALHIVNGWLVLVIARRLGMRPVFAFLTALLFVIQPAFVAAVAWVGAIAESLIVFFGCTSALAVLRFRDTGRRVWLVLAVAAFVLALCSHESAIVFLPIIFLVDHVAARRSWPGFDLVRLAWPFIAIAAGYLAMTFAANTSEYLGGEIGYRFGPHVIRNVFEYIAAIYVGDKKLLSHVFVALVLLVVLWKGNARARLGVAWMMLGILPFAPFETGILSRYTYVPAIGFAILLGEGLASLHHRLARRSIALAHGAVLVLAIGIGVRSVHFARDGVKDHFLMAERYRVFLTELRQAHPQLENGAVVTLSAAEISALNPPFVEAAVFWEYQDKTLRVMLPPQ